MFVDARDGDGIEVGAEQSSRRRCFLDLGDDGHAIRLFKGGAEIARRGRFAETLFQDRIRHLLAGGGDFLTFVGDDAIEDAAHVASGQPLAA